MQTFKAANLQSFFLTAVTYAAFASLILLETRVSRLKGRAVHFSKNSKSSPSILTTSITGMAANLRYVLYFCRRMTNAAVTTIVQNCPNFTHFRLCIMNPGEPDYLTNEPIDEAFVAVAKTCIKLQRLSVSGLLTDTTFENIGKYAKNLETLSVAFAGKSDRGMQCVLEGCLKLRKLEIRDSPFGNTALLSGLEKYEMMRSLWISACNLTMKGCRTLAKEMPRLNVEVIRDDGGDETDADRVYFYRSVAGPRRDAPPFVLTL